MWFTAQADGYRGWFLVKLNDGSLRTGLAAGNFTVTVVEPSDGASNNPAVSESGEKVGTYYFDVPSAFLIANGNGEYNVTVEVDTFAGPSGPPNVRDSMSTVMQVSLNDFDDIGVQLQGLLTELNKVRHADGVFISDDRGAEGTTHDFGTRANPVKGPTTTLDAGSNAVIIATADGSRKFMFLDDSVYTLGQAFEDWVFEGETVPVINMNSQTLAGSQFFRCIMMGEGSPLTAFECSLLNCDVYSTMFRCAFMTGITFGGGNYYQCYFDASDVTIEGDVDVYGGSGKMTIASMSGGILNLDDFRGEVVFSSGCTGGTIRLTGSGKLTDNSGAGCTVDSTGFISLGGIDTELSDAHGSGSWEGAGGATWTDPEKEQIRDVLGVDGTKTTAVGGQAQTILADTEFIRDMEEGRWELTDEGGGMWVVYDADNTTIKAKFATFDSDGVRTRDPLKIVKRTRVV